MAGFSDYLEDKINDMIFNQTNITAPTAIYFSLHSADPGDTGASELSGNNYSRVTVTTKFSPSSSGACTNDTTWNGPTASGAWTAATHWGLWDNSTTGNFLVGGALGATITVTSGGYYTMAVGDLDWTTS